MSAGKGSGGESKNRYFPRINAEVLLAYRTVDAPADEARVVNSSTIGLGGLMFEADHPLPVGTTFLLDLVLGEEHLTVSAKVVYTRKVNNDNFQNGFSFVDLTDDQRERLLGFFLQEYEKLPPDAP